ncbi:uncharacterized protein LOC135469640 [Liolophura sinensis]|uniref:uncharacterized protein LOC135469640 n=1 Tax=Liolophura sinensis TaxID=3198878 RepID=UPI00315952D5
MEHLQLIASVDHDLTIIASNYRAVQKIDEQATIVYCQKLAELAQSVSEKTRGQYDLYLLLLCKIMDQLRLIYIYLAPTMARLELCQQLFVLCTKAILGIQWSQLPEDDPGKRGLRIVLDATHKMLSPAGYTRIELLLDLMDTHWGDPTLSKIMSNDCEDEQEGKAYIEKEDQMVLKLRVEVLLEEDCDEFVINLCHWCTFHPMLKDDLYLRQTQLLLLHRHNYVAKFREECRKISCDFGVQVVKSLEQQEQHRGVCVLLAQTFLIQDWINPNSYCCTKDLLKLWIRHQYLSDKDVDKFSDSVWSIAKLSRNTKQLGMLIEALRKECGLEKFLQLYTDLAIYALNLDKGIWDCAKSFGDEGAIGMSEKAIARTCVQIYNLYQDLNPQVQQRSIITAFALDPTPEHFTQLGKIYEKKVVAAGMQKVKEEGQPVSSSIVESDSINVDSLKQALPCCREQTVVKQLSLEETAPVASTSSDSQVVITDNTKMQMQVDMGSARILEKGSNTAVSINPATLYEMDRLLKLFRPWFFNPLLQLKDLYIVARDYIANDKTLSPEIETQIKRTIEKIEDEHDKGCDTVQLEQGNVVSRDQFLAQVLELQRAAFKKRGRGRPPLKKVSAPETDNKEVQKSSNLLEKMYKTVYKCLICSTLHEDVQRLKEHVRSICRPEETDTQKDNEADTVGKQPSSCPLLKCRLCSAVKPTLQEFELHLATNHAAECDGTGGNIKICHLYRCKYCKVFFSRREDLQNHLNVCSVKLQRIANGEIQPKPTGDSPASVVSSCSPNNEDGKMLPQNIAKTDIPISGAETDIASDGTPMVKKKRGRKKKTESANDLNGESGKKGVHFHSTSDSEIKQPKKRGRKRKEAGKEEGNHTDTNESQSDRGEGRKVFHRKVKDVAKENSATRELIEKLLKSKNDDGDSSGKGKSKTKHGKLCEICATKFRNSKTLLQHYAMSHIRPYKFFTNKGKNAFMCFYCRKFFVTFLKYVNHIHLHEQRITSAVKTFKTTNPGLTAASGPKSLDDSDSDSSDDTVNLARPTYASTDSSTEVDASESKDSNFGTEESSMESSSVDTPTTDSKQVGLSLQDKFHFPNKLVYVSAESSSTDVDFENEVSTHLIPNIKVDSAVNRNESAHGNTPGIQEPYIEKVIEESAVSSCEKTCSEYEPSTCPSSSEISTGVESNTEESAQDDFIGIESVDEEFMQFRSAPTVLQSHSKGAEAVMLETSISGMEMTPLPSDWNASLHTFVENVSGGLIDNGSDDKESVSTSSADMTESTVPMITPLPHTNVSKEQQDSVQCDLDIERPVEKPETSDESIPDNSVKQKSFADEFASIISMAKSIESVTVNDKMLRKLEDNDQVIPSPDCGHPANLVLTESDQSCTTLCPSCGQIVPGDPETSTQDSPPCMTISPVLSHQSLGNPEWRKMLTKQLSVTITAKDRALCSLASKKLSFGVDSKSRKARSSSLDCDNKAHSPIQHQRHRRSSANLQGCAAKVEGRSQALKSNPDVRMEVTKKVTRRVSRCSSGDPSLTDPVLAKAPKTCVKEKQISPQKTEVIIDTVDISGICALFATCESEPMSCGDADCEKTNSCNKECVQNKHICTSDNKGGNSGEVKGTESISKSDEVGRVRMDNELKTVPKCKIQSGEGEKKHVEAQLFALLSNEAQTDTNMQRDDKKDCLSAKEKGKGTTASNSTLGDTMENSEIISKDVSGKGHTWSLILNIVDSKLEESSPKDNFSVENLPSTTKDCSSVVAQLTFKTKESADVPLAPSTNKDKSLPRESGKPFENEQSYEETMTHLFSHKKLVVTDSFCPDKADIPLVKTRDSVKSTQQIEVHDEIVHSVSQEATEGVPTTSVSLASTEVTLMCPKPPQSDDSSQCLSTLCESFKQVKEDLKESPAKPMLIELALSKIDDEVHNKSSTVEKQSIVLTAEIAETSNMQQVSDGDPSGLSGNTWSCVDSCNERGKETVDSISCSMSCGEVTMGNLNTADQMIETSTRKEMSTDLWKAFDKPGNELISQHQGILKSVSEDHIQDSAPKSERSQPTQHPPTLKERQNPLHMPKPVPDEINQSIQAEIVDTNKKSLRSIAASPSTDAEVPMDVYPGEIILDKGIYKEALDQVPHTNTQAVDHSTEDAVVVSSSRIVETSGMDVRAKDECHACSEELKHLPCPGSDEVISVSLMSGGLDELKDNPRDYNEQLECTVLIGLPILASSSDQLHNKEEELEDKYQSQVKGIIEVDKSGGDPVKKDIDGNAVGLLSVAFGHNEETDVSCDGQIHDDAEDAEPITKDHEFDTFTSVDHTAIDDAKEMSDESRTQVADTKDSCRSRGADTGEIADVRDMSNDTACANTGETADLIYVNEGHILVPEAKGTAPITKGSCIGENHTTGAQTRDTVEVTCLTEDNSTIADTQDILCGSSRTDGNASVADIKDVAHDGCLGEDNTTDADSRELADVHEMSIEHTLVADVEDVSHDSCMSENCQAGADTRLTGHTTDAETKDVADDHCTSDGHISGADTEDIAHDNSMIEDHTSVAEAKSAAPDMKGSCMEEDYSGGAQIKEIESVSCTAEDNTIGADSTRVIADVGHITQGHGSVARAKDAAPITKESCMDIDHSTGATCMTEDNTTVTDIRETADVRHMTQDHTSVTDTAVFTNDFTEKVSGITGDIVLSHVNCSEREATNKRCSSPPETIDEKSVFIVNEVLEYISSKDHTEELPNHNANVEDEQESLYEHSGDHVLPCQSTRSKIKRKLSETALSETCKVNKCLGSVNSDGVNSGLIQVKDDCMVQNSEEIDSQAASSVDLKEGRMSSSPENQTEMHDHVSRDQISSIKKCEQSLDCCSPCTESNISKNSCESQLNKDNPDHKTGEESESPMKRKPGRPKKETVVTKTERMVTRQTPTNPQLPISRPQRKRTRTCLGNDYIYQFPFKQPRSKDPSTQIKKETTLKPCDKEAKSINHPMTRLRGSGSKGKNLPGRCSETGKKASKEQKMFVNKSMEKTRGITGNRGRRVSKQMRPSSTNHSRRLASKQHHKTTNENKKDPYLKDVPQKVLRSGKKAIDYQKTIDASCSSSLKSVQKTSTTDRVTRSSEVPNLHTKSPETEDIPPISTNQFKKPSREMDKIDSGKENAARTEETGWTNDADEAQLTNSDVLPRSKGCDGGNLKTSDIDTCTSGNTATHRNTMNNSLGTQKCENIETCEKAYEITETPKHVPENTEGTCGDVVNSENTIAEPGCKLEDQSSDQCKDKNECRQAEDEKCCDVEKKSEDVSAAAPSVQATNPTQADVKSDERRRERIVGFPLGVYSKTADGSGPEKEQKLGSGNIYRVQRCAGTQTSGNVPKNKLSAGNTYGDKTKVVTRDTSMEIDAERKANFVRMGRTMSLKSRLLPKSSKPFTWDMDDNGDHISSGESRDTKKQADSQPEEPTLLTLRKSLRSRNFEPIHRDKNFEVIKRGAVHKAAREGQSRGSASNLAETGSAKNTDATPFEMVYRMATRRAQKSQNEGGGKRPIGDAHISSGVKPQLPGCSESNISLAEIKGVPTRVSKRKVESGTNTDMRITKCAKIDNVLSAAKPFTPKGSFVRNCQWAPRRNQRTASVNSTNIIVTYPGGSNSVITANPNTSKTVINNHIAQQLSGSNLDQVMTASKQQDRIPCDDCANSDSGSSNGDSSASGQKWKMQRKPGKQGFSFSFTKARIH